MVTHSLHPVTESSNDKLTPAAAFRNKYYLSQQQQQQQDKETIPNESPPTTTILTAAIEVEQDDEDFIYRPGAIIYAPLNTTLPGVETASFTLSDGDEDEDEDEDDDDDDEDNISIKTIESNHTTLFEPTSDLEPKIILQDQSKINDNNVNNALVASSSTLLSKLSKSTAPMRAKLSTLSRSKSELDI
jgi:hypothetical protein